MKRLEFVKGPNDGHVSWCEIAIAVGTARHKVGVWVNDDTFAVFAHLLDKMARAEPGRRFRTLFGSFMPDIAGGAVELTFVRGTEPAFLATVRWISEDDKLADAVPLTETSRVSLAALARLRGEADALAGPDAGLATLPLD